MHLEAESMKRRFVLMGLVPLLGCLLLGGLMIMQRRARTPPVTAGLRGGVFMIVRISTRPASLYQIWFSPDDTATWGSPLTDERQEISLTLTEQQAVQATHQQWCVDDSPIRTLQSRVSEYEVGLLCGTSDRWWIKQLRVPIEVMPAELMAIIQRAPAPAQR